MQLFAASYWLFLTGLLFFPLAFGTVELWSMTYAQGFIASSLFVYQLGYWRNSGATPWFLPPGTWPLVLLCAYLLLQLVPLPPFLLKIISPNAWEIYSETIWVAAPGSWLPLTVAVKETLAEFFRLAAGSALYLLTVQLLSRKDYQKTTLKVVIALAATLALVAIIQKFTSPQAIYWMREAPANSSPMGPWVCRNHYAGFMELLLPPIAALFLYHTPRIRYKTTWRRRLALLLSLPEAQLHLLLGGAAVLVALSIMLSLSRSGITSMALSLLLYVFLLKKNAGNVKAIILGVITLLIILAVTWFGWDPIVQRFDRLVTAEGEVADLRLAVWRDTLAMIRDFPLTGAGFGSFLTLYPAYRTAAGHAIFDHAHNDYLELCTDGGIIAVGLVGWFLFDLFRKTLGIIGNRQDRYAILLSYGILCGLVALLLHGFTDFNFHNGANTFYFFFCCGLLVAVASVRRHSHTSKFYLQPATSRWPRYLALPCALIVIGSALFNGGQLRGQYLFAQYRLAAKQESANNPAVALGEQITACVQADPLAAHYRFAAGQFQQRQGNGAAALADYRKAVELNPLNCHSLQWLGYLLSFSDTAQADALYAAATRLNPKNVACLQSSLQRLFGQQRRAEAVALLNSSLALEPSDLQYYLPLLAQEQPSREELALLLPELPATYIAYAKFLWEKNEKQRALVLYEQGLEFLDREAALMPWYFTLGYGWYRELQQEERAFDLLRQAVHWLPDQADFHEKLGDMYQQRAIPYRAMEEYERVMVIDPANARVKKKLAELKNG